MEEDESEAHVETTASRGSYEQDRYNKKLEQGRPGSKAIAGIYAINRTPTISIGGARLPAE